MDTKTKENPWDCVPHDELFGFQGYPEVGDLVSPAKSRHLALIVALRGTGSVSPNPLVGAVAVDAEHRFLGAAAHLRVGEAHAEAGLLQDLARNGLMSRLQGGKLYVTLEPCAHHGRTPPCAEAIARLPLAEVVYGFQDPDPRVNGAGAACIREGGIRVTLDESWVEDCRELAEFFLRSAERKGPAGTRPAIFVGMKVASTLDGLVARRGDQRTWITGERARAHGHYLRLRYDAILIGPGTFLADNPSLTVRHPVVGRTPLRIVLDPVGEVVKSPRVLESNLFQSQPEKTLIMVGEGVDVGDSVRKSGVRVEYLPAMPRFEWSKILNQITSEGVQSLLIEGGAGVYGSALASGVVDKIHWYRSPDDSGLPGDDPAALRWVGHAGIPPALQIRRSVSLGRDTLIEGYWRRDAR